MAENKKLLTGVIPALVTPFRAGGGVDEDAVEKIVNLHLEAGVTGFYLCGSTGEGLHSTIDERKAMTEATMKVMASASKKVPVVVMVASAEVEEAIALAKHAESLGCDAVSSVVPPKQPGDIDAAVSYWAAIAGATSLPFYVYWIAATADASVTPESFLGRMKEVPNFAGFKFTDKNFYMFQQLMAVGKEQGVNGVTGPDEMMAAGFIMGSDGCIGSTYNVHPKVALEAYHAIRSGDNKKATECQWEMNKTINVLLTKCSSVQAGIKTVYKLKYGIDCGVTKEALGPAPTQAEEDALMAALADCRVE